MKFHRASGHQAPTDILPDLLPSPHFAAEADDLALDAHAAGVVDQRGHVAVGGAQLETLSLEPLTPGCARPSPKWERVNAGGLVSLLPVGEGTGMRVAACQDHNIGYS